MSLNSMHEIFTQMQEQRLASAAAQLAAGAQRVGRLLIRADGADGHADGHPQRPADGQEGGTGHDKSAPADGTAERYRPDIKG